MSKHLGLPILLGVITVIAACGGQLVDNHNHRCQVLDTNYEWEFLVRLDLIHSDARECPQSPQVGQQISTGGTLEEPAPFPWPDSGRSKDVLMNVHRTDNHCGTPLGNIVGSATGNFSFMDWDYDNNQDWTVQIAGAFNAATGQDTAHDCPVFSVGLRGTTNRAIAHTRLNYHGELLDRRDH
jgi:hypothetical protein